MKILLHITIVLLVIGVAKITAAQTNDRYAAPKINQAHSDFLKRGNRDLLNVDFIIANALGEAKSALNDGEQTGQNAINGDQNITGSVVVQPGADADNVTIININEGDVSAISR